jgi:deoxyribonuclease V
MRLHLHHEHPWDLAPRDAARLQAGLARHLVEAPLPDPVRTVAGVDVSVRGGRVRTAIVVLDADSLRVADRATWEGDVAYPYVPGLLSFREIPAVLPALERLVRMPDVIVCDGQGRAHPRRFGLACHLGLLLDLPCFGVAKTRLVGTHEDPMTDRGARTSLRDGEELLGEVVRTRAGVKPVFVSVGHRIRLEDAVRLTLELSPRFRLPEPTRLAHQLSRDGRLPGLNACCPAAPGIRTGSTP